MKEIKAQVNLLRRVRALKTETQRLRLATWQFKYLGSFFKKHGWLLSGLIVLLIVQGLLEALLIVFSRDQLSTAQRLFLAPYFWQFLIIFLIIFFVNSFFSIRLEKTWIVLLANNIRRRIFKSYLDRPLNQMHPERKAELIAKISYHLPLVSMGVSNSFFGILRWLIYVGVATWIAFLAGLNWGPILLVMIFLSLAIAVAAYLVARKYISQEVTFYSQMIKYVDQNLSDKDFIKFFGQEAGVLEQFDRLVEFDSFFRIRRDLWMKMGFKVVFAILLVVSVVTHFFSQEFFTWINLTGADTKFLFLFLLIYFSRSLNEGLRVGLFLFPARLGIFLTILKSSRSGRREQGVPANSNLVFYSRKTKLFKEGVYYRRLQFIFQPGDRCLIWGPNRIGKTALAKIFMGLEAFNPRAIKVKVNGERLDYRTWQAWGRGLCFFAPHFNFSGSLMEFILGKEKTKISPLEIETALAILSQHNSLVSLVTSHHNFNSSALEVLANPLSAAALYSLHCLVTKPAFVAVDNLYLDLNYPEIIEMLKTLDKELPETTLVLMGTHDNNYLNYKHRYNGYEKFTEII